MSKQERKDKIKQLEKELNELKKLDSQQDKIELTLADIRSTNKIHFDLEGKELTFYSEYRQIRLSFDLSAEEQASILVPVRNFLESKLIERVE